MGKTGNFSVEDDRKLVRAVAEYYETHGRNKQKSWTQIHKISQLYNYTPKQLRTRYLNLKKRANRTSTRRQSVGSSHLEQGTTFGHASPRSTLSPMEEENETLPDVPPKTIAFAYLFQLAASYPSVRALCDTVSALYEKEHEKPLKAETIRTWIYRLKEPNALRDHFVAASEYFVLTEDMYESFAKMIKKKSDANNDFVAINVDQSEQDQTENDDSTPLDVPARVIVFAYLFQLAPSHGSLSALNNAVSALYAEHQNGTLEIATIINWIQRLKGKKGLRDEFVAASEYFALTEDMYESLLKLSRLKSDENDVAVS